MKNKKWILFDLDGTLTESGIGITNSVKYALKKFGIEENDYDVLKRFIGPPLIDAFMEIYGFSKEDAKKAVSYYREYYRETGLFENAVYSGIVKLLTTLKDAGKTLFIATAKPDDFSMRILKHFDLAKYFSFFACATFDGTRLTKDDVISYAITEGNITDVSQAVMIGDRKQDILGAKAFNMDSVGVLYGYGSREELETAGVDYIAETADDILELLI